MNIHKMVRPIYRYAAHVTGPQDAGPDADADGAVSRHVRSLADTEQAVKLAESQDLTHEAQKTTKLLAGRTRPPNAPGAPTHKRRAASWLKFFRRTLRVEAPDAAKQSHHMTNRITLRMPRSATPGSLPAVEASSPPRRGRGRRPIVDRSNGQELERDGIIDTEPESEQEDSLRRPRRRQIPPARRTPRSAEVDAE